MMRPDADTDSFRDMREMADRITKMTAVLGDVVERFVRGLCAERRHRDAHRRHRGDPRSGKRVRRPPQRRHRDRLADTDIDQPLVYRELAILLDELANTIEDLTDRIVVIASKEPGIVTDTDPDADVE